MTIEDAMPLAVCFTRDRSGVLARPSEPAMLLAIFLDCLRCLSLTAHPMTHRLTQFLRRVDLPLEIKMSQNLARTLLEVISYRAFNLFSAVAKLHASYHVRLHRYRKTWDLVVLLTDPSISD